MADGGDENGHRCADCGTVIEADADEDAFVLEVFSETRAELLSRRLLCADCYAGVWTYRSDQ